jgi:energy-coupling factor transport system ATP-binding protein
VSLSVEPGTCLVVAGPSGSGKSTLALALSGLVPGQLPGEWHGRLEVDGRPPTGPATGAVGLLFQDPDRQLVMDRAEDDVAFGLENRGWPVDAMRARVPEALAEVGLAGFERRRPTRLSGGEQQRLALAGVLAPRPGLLVLDEPTANLDPVAADALMQRLAELRRDGRTTIVLIDHDADRAWPLADQVLALADDGSPIDAGEPRVVLGRSGPAMRAAGIWLPGERVDQAATGAEPATALRAGHAIVAARDVSFAFDDERPVVRGVSMTIRSGERVALVGPNGSGKSTLGRLLVGLLRPGAGSVALGGADPARLPAASLARRAGYAFQDPERQFLAATVREEIRLGLRRDEVADVDALMEQVRLPLTRFADRSPYRLSGGEQRRLSLAAVLIRRPELLVLDEPTFGQDRRGHEALLAILHERVDDGGGVLAATHDRRFVDAFATRVIAMADGRLFDNAAAA